jgi:hypothetical protein
MLILMAILLALFGLAVLVGGILAMNDKRDMGCFNLDKYRNGEGK